MDDGVWSAASKAAAAKAQTWTSGHGGKGDKAGSSRRRQRPGAEGGVVAAASELHVVGRVVYQYRARGVYRAALLPPRLEGDGGCVAGGGGAGSRGAGDAAKAADEGWGRGSVVSESMVRDHLGAK